MNKIFVIQKKITKITKILDHGNLELYAVVVVFTYTCCIHWLLCCCYCIIVLLHYCYVCCMMLLCFVCCIPSTRKNGYANCKLSINQSKLCTLRMYVCDWSEKTSLISTQNTPIHNIMLSISFSVCAIQNM